MDLRFPRSAKLRSSRDYTRVFKSSRRLRAAHFLLLYRDNQGTRPRLGVVLAKRKIPSAVARNQAKRHIMESFRCNQHQLPAIDIVLVWTHPVKQPDPGDIALTLKKLWLTIKRSAKKFA